MQSKVDQKRLIEHFSEYIDYKRGVRKPAQSFAEKIKDSAPRKAEERDPGSTVKDFTLPRLGRAKTITETQAKRLAKLAPIIQEASAKYNVPVELICGVILQESGGRSRAVSHAGAKGLMQLMPATAKRFGVKNTFDAKENIEGGTKYLRWLLDRFDGNIELALAGYNAGEANVEKYGNKVPPFAETKAYVPNVLGYTQTMVNIILASRTDETELPAHARRA